MKLYNLLTPDNIALDVHAGDRKDAIECLVDILAKSGKLSDFNQVKAAVLRREEEVGTGIGYGVAIPHSDPGPYPEPLAAFCRLKTGIDFHAIDAKPARLIFLLLTPEKTPALHVRLLARICRLLKSLELRNALLNAKDANQAANILAEAESDFPELTP